MPQCSVIRHLLIEIEGLACHNIGGSGIWSLLGGMARGRNGRTGSGGFRGGGGGFGGGGASGRW